MSSKNNKIKKKKRNLNNGIFGAGEKTERETKKIQAPMLVIMQSAIRLNNKGNIKIKQHRKTFKTEYSMWIEKIIVWIQCVSLFALMRFLCASIGRVLGLCFELVAR